MPKKNSNDDKPEGAPAWMCTFSDMTTLLLTFFVMLVALSNFESAKVKEAIISLKGALGVLRPGVQIITQPSPEFRFQSNKPPRQGEQETPEKKRERILEQLVKNGLERMVAPEIVKEGIVLVALSPVFFEPGSAQIMAEAYGDLSVIASIMSEYKNDVRIEGHTSDATAEINARYRNNWDLSGARALAILEYFVKYHGLDEKRMSFTGYGATRPRVSNQNIQGRYLNERIEIKLLTDTQPEDPSTHLRTQRREIPNDTETILSSPVIETASP